MRDLPASGNAGPERHSADTTWFRVFHSMFRSSEAAKMKPFAVVVYFALKSHAKFETGKTFPRIELIAAETGMSVSTVLRALKTLEDFSYITRRREGRHNDYQLREKVAIRDSSDRIVAVATWDYVPVEVSAATADLKNIVMSGNWAGSKTLHIEHLKIDINGSDRRVTGIDGEAPKGAPPEWKELVLSLKNAFSPTTSSDKYTGPRDHCPTDTGQTDMFPGVHSCLTDTHQPDKQCLSDTLTR